KAHQGDEPEGGVTGDGEGKTHDVGLARAPVAVQDRRRAFPIDVAWTLNAGRYQLLQFQRSDTRATKRFIVDSLRRPLPFNAADEISCRAGAIKCSRCRASFAPIYSKILEQKLVSPLDRLLAGLLSETKNWRKLLIRNFWRQVNLDAVFT